MVVYVLHKVCTVFDFRDIYEKIVYRSRQSSSECCTGCAYIQEDDRMMCELDVQLISLNFFFENKEEPFSCYFWYKNFLFKHYNSFDRLVFVFFFKATSHTR